MRRRPVVVALVVVALAALALVVAPHVVTHEPTDLASAADSALTPAGPGADAAVARNEGQNGRDRMASQRPLKQRLVLLAAAAAILGVPGLARRRAVVLGARRGPLVGWVAAHGSRSPPPLQLLTP